MVASLGSLCYSVSQIALWAGAILLVLGIVAVIWSFKARKGAKKGALFYLGSLAAVLGLLSIMVYLALPAVMGRLLGIDNFPAQTCQSPPAASEALPYCGSEYCGKSGPYSNRTDCFCSVPL